MQPSTAVVGARSGLRSTQRPARPGPRDRANATRGTGSSEFIGKVPRAFWPEAGHLVPMKCASCISRGRFANCWIVRRCAMRRGDDDADLVHAVMVGCRRFWTKLSQCSRQGMVRACQAAYSSGGKQDGEWIAGFYARQLLRVQLRPGQRRSSGPNWLFVSSPTDRSALDGEPVSRSSGGQIRLLTRVSCGVPILGTKFDCGLGYSGGLRRRRGWQARRARKHFLREHVRGETIPL